MKVFVCVNGGPLLNNLDRLRQACGIEDIYLGANGHQVVKYSVFRQLYFAGVTIRDDNYVLMIAGGHASIVAALRSAQLTLIPANPTINARIMAEDEGRSLAQLASTAAKAGLSAVAHAHGGPGNVLERTATAFIATGKIHQANFRSGHSFAYVQLYSGATRPGDLVVSAGAGNSDTFALATALVNSGVWA
jgi:hypothetical protein